MDVIEQDLHQRVDRAQQQQWFGDLEQLRVTLDHLKAKKEQVVMITDGSPSQVSLIAVPPMTVPDLDQSVRNADRIPIGATNI